MSSKDQKKGTQLMNQELHNAIANGLYSHSMKYIKSRLDDLKKILRGWSIAKNVWNNSAMKDITLIKDYLAAQNEYYEQDQFNQYFALLDNFDVNMALIEDMRLILKSYQLFSKAVWPIRFHSKFVSKIQSYNNPDEIFYILAHVDSLACGNISSFSGVRPINFKTIPMNRFFCQRILRERNLFIHIGVQKQPVIKNGVIKRYEFVQYMHFLDILGDQYVQNKKKQDERMNFFTNQIFSDAAKKDHSEELEIDQEKFKGGKYNYTNKQYLFKEVLNEYTERYEYYDTPLPDNKNQIFYPIPFKTYYVSTAENSTVIYDDTMKRWISKDHLTAMQRKKLMEYQKQISDSMIKRFVDFQSAKSLVELLTKIPNFKVNLTQQEKDVIGENGNVLAIGRSGTGKTTCAVLRLFSIEMLFKIRLSLYKKKFQDTIQGVRCGSNDIDEAVGLHCIFLTASPVLTHEIQRYYKKLTDNIKTELEKKKKRVAEQQKQKELEEKEKAEEEIKEESHENEESFEQLNATEEEIVQPQSKVQANEPLEAPVVLQTRKSAEQIEQQQQMNEQFEGIELKQDLNNEQFKEEEEDIDELKNKFQESIKKFHSLYDLTEQDYPGFFTVKSYIMMIDGVLQKPFFIRSKNTIINEDSKASWHNERKGVMMIENYYRGEQQQKEPLDVDKIEEEFNYSDEEELEHEYLRQIQLRENKEKQQLTKKLQKNKIRNMLSFEVDYDYFVVHFWPKVIKKYYSSRNITPHLVWTEIYSTIKGSADSHQYPGQYLTQKAYMSTTANTFLTDGEKMDIYETFCQYQRWKIRSGGYDIMDAVNYILNILRYRGYEGPEIHYLMIDEVQDLPHAIVFLLSKTATYGVFYSGDTAQTIAKGVGFRFCDLKSLFNPIRFTSSLQLKTPIMKHLTINFRSHNNILQLANSVVSSLEILFPKTIDRLKKEVSDLHGPKPMILSSSDEELLFYVLCGGEEKKIEGQENSMKKPPLEFGCDQVIIVRDQESKARVPSMLQHALCLTIYEAKGLEFNDVILFNFFEESPCPEKWLLLKNLYVATTEIPKDEYQKNLSRHNPQEQKQDDKKEEESKKGEQKKEEQLEEEVYADEIFNKKTNSYTVKKLINNNTKNFKDINDYAELCSQLKLLYTAITRPKKTLIIYDAGKASAREPMERIWERLDVIEIITKELVLESLNRKSNKGVSEEVKIFKTIVTATDKSQWKQQGLKMYARGYFDQAMKCFDRSGNQELYLKAEANKYADEATKKLIEIESERNTIKQGAYHVKEMNRNELIKYKKKLKSEEGESLKKFLNAARIFEDLHMFKQAGQCFFSGKSFERAFESFCKAFMNRQAAESLYMQNKYREASEYYQRDGNYLKAIECLDMVNEWTLILQKIQKFSTTMNDFQKQALLKKYSALALEELVYEIEFENEEESSKPENNRVEVIQEKQSDEEDEEDDEDEDEDEDPELAAEREYERKMSEQLSNPSRKQSELSEQHKQLIDIKESVYQQLGELNQKPSEDSKQEKQGDNSMSFSALNNSEMQAPQRQQQKAEGVKSIDESFGDLNRSQQPIVLEGVKSEDKMDLESIGSSFSELNAKYENDLEPDIESIKSLVDPDDIWVKNSISEITHKLHSEYSVMDDLEESFPINAKIIKTKGNIFVQDEIMRKIVNIVSIINSSVQEFFKQFKGYQSLISVSSADHKEIIDSRPEISEFEDIDPKFINIILDTLESFKLFKLCLFVCNRYHLPAKAGRYLISLGMKYSTNCISNNIVNPILLSPSSYRKLEIEKGILASIAIHAIYENVNAEFLKIKVSENEEENKNTLGGYFIEGLILEGLYKKAVFMVNPQQSLKILSNYNDFEAFNSIFKQKILKQISEQSGSITFLEKPKTKEELAYTKMLLRKVIFENCVVHRFQTVSSRYYQEFEKGDIDVVKRLSKFDIPHYLPFTKVLISSVYMDDLIKGFASLVEKGYSILTNGNSVECLDFISTLLAIVHSEDLRNTLVEQFTNDNFLQLFRCTYFIKTVLKKLSGRNALNVIDAVLSMHQCYRIAYCKSMTFVNDTFSFVNRTSTIANELVENQKTNSGNFAYFFEQDYNYILVKTSRIIKIISRKYEEALSRLYKKRIERKIDNQPLLYEHWIEVEQDMVIKKALTFQIENLGDPKKRKKQETLARKKSKQLKSGYDFRCKGREHVVKLQSSSESEEEDYVDKQPKFYRNSANPKMKYLSNAMFHWFNEQSINSKEIVEGRFLYGCGLNSSYREYTQKLGGFNLYDALEFQKFRRVDLFAENVLSVYDKLTLFSKHNFLAEILTLLLVQLKAQEDKKGFALSVPTDLLKYFEGLKFMGQKAPHEAGETLEASTLLSNNVECKFTYTNKYVSEMNIKDLSAIICDYLDILLEEESSQFVNLPAVVIMYVTNVGRNNEINESLRKVVKNLGQHWKKSILHSLIDCKSAADFDNKKKSLLNSPLRQYQETLHLISVDSKGDLEDAIAESEFDYEVESRIIAGRAKAVSKIAKWWRAKRNELREKRGEASNYFEYTFEPSSLTQAKKPDLFGDIRLIRCIHKGVSNFKLLVKTEKAKTELLSFYLTTTISSSLDFHFILMSLNKIEECRKHYFQYCTQDKDELHEYEIEDIHQEMTEILATLELWKNDEKWLREKKINFKKKKVFEVKWMTKNIGSFGSILKKRAGLKKQAILQDKRKFIKRMK